MKAPHLIVFLVLLLGFTVSAQTPKKIEVVYSGFTTKDSILGPNVTKLTRNDKQQIHIVHEGINMYCDQALYYNNEDFIEAYGDVNMVQGDTIHMNSNYVEYSGITQLAFAAGDVVLKEPKSTLTTDTLHFDRTRQLAFYNTGGKVVRDSSGTITSRIGRYYMQDKKYRFVNEVVLVNPEYTLTTNQLDFFSESGHAYMYGPSTIVGETSTIYCERGFYDTNNDNGYFIKNSRINYDNRIVEGDSLYFDRSTSFASATNNIKVTDTLNNSVIRGHYGEVFREKDSVFITKRALAITVQEQDSVYLHSDIIMVTGKPEHRVTRAYYNAKLYKSDLSGKADSIHADNKTGLTQLINLKRFSTGDAFSVDRKPIIWSDGNQMTGDSIHLISNVEKEELDSLKVFNNAFLISKDTLGDGYTQIKGQRLIGLFKDNEIYNIDIIKNAEVIAYLRDDKDSLVGIDKSQSGSINMTIIDGYKTISKINRPEGQIYPIEEFPENARLFRGFDWRDDERPTSVEDLFADDPPLELPIIKGLDPYVPEEEVVNESMRARIREAGKKDSDRVNKAGRNVQKTKRRKDLPKTDASTESKPPPKLKKKTSENDQ